MANEVAILKTGESTLKWGLVAGTVGIGGYYLMPIVLATVIGWLEIAVITVILVAFFYAYPALCEFLASFGFRAWEAAIRKAPIQRMKRDSIAAAKEIDEYEKNIANADQGITSMERTIDEQKKFLTPDDLAQFQEQIKELHDNKALLIGQRDTMVKALDDFNMKIKRYEAKYQVGGAFKSSLSALKFSQKVGIKSEGSQIAFDQVDKDLESSRSALKLAMSRPKQLIEIK